MLKVRSLLVSGALLLGAPVFANDFEALLGVARNVWPEKQHLAVVCDYGNPGCRAQVEALAQAAGGDRLITVVDARTSSSMGAAVTLLGREQPDFLVLLPEERRFHEGAYDAALLIRRMTQLKVPVLATTARGFDHGVAFVVGPATGGELKVNTRLKGSIDVILPDKAHLVGRQAMREPAALRVSSAR